MLKSPKPKRSEGEETLALHLRAEKIPFIREYRFCPPRKWRFDFLIGDSLAVEVDGGIFVQGHHSTGSGIEKDMEKQNTATLVGYSLMRFSTGLVKSGDAINFIRAWVEKDKRDKT